MNKVVSINILNDNYVIKGDITSILKNRRLLMGFRRLNYIKKNDTINIQFFDNLKISILKDIQELLEKFEYRFTFQDNIKNELSTYSNEQESFRVFSEKAKNIRDNKFSDNLELVENFKEFKEVLNKKMKRTLYELQMLSAFHMAFSQNSCNFAVPGAGKTTIVYAAYIYLKNLPKDNSKHVDKILVIGPLSSFSPWENEYKDCFGKDIESQRLSGDSSVLRIKKEQHLYSTNPKELTLISHAGVSILEKEIIDFLKQNKTMVVIDEAHRIKNAKGVWGKSVVKIAEEAVSRVILTGTPVPNGYEDLYNLYRFIYPFKFEEILNFHYDQLKDLTKNSLSAENDRVNLLISNINPYFIRIRKKDLHLPEVRENMIYIDMDDKQKEIYNFIEEKYIESFKNNNSGTIKDVLNKAKLIRLRQAATNPSLLLKTLQESFEESEYKNDLSFQSVLINNETINDSVIFKEIKDYNELNIPKFSKIKELLNKKIFIKNGKAIIWTIFVQNAESLKKYLELNNIKSELLIGKILLEDRQEIIKKFNNPDNLDFQVVIANPFSVSESISLHKGCHNAIYMERDYNCSNFLQSKDRIHRYGLDNNIITNYYYLVSKNSIDSVINKKLNEKVIRMEKIIDEDIPLFKRIDEADETDIIKSLLEDYARRS